jgi:hypothetical protein
VVGSGLLVGFAAVGREVVPAALGRPVPLWPGVATLLVGGGLLGAAAIGAEGASVRLATYRFGWRQPLAAVLAALTVLVPLALGASWLHRGASSVLSTGQPDILPAYVQVASEVPARPRALVLQDQGGGVVGYALVSGEGRRLGDAEVAPPVSTTQGLGPAVSTLLSGTGALSQVRFVAGFGVGFVVVDAPVDPTLERRLDGTPGLERVSAVSTGAVWRLVPAGARVALRVPPGPWVTVPADPSQPVTSVNADLGALAPSPRAGAAPGAAGMLWLAETADAGWQASVDGRRLPAQPVDGWAQGFGVDSSTPLARLTVRYVDDRGRWLLVQAAAVVLLILLALPSWRRREDLDEPDELDERAGVGAPGGVPAPPGGVLAPTDQGAQVVR